MARWRESFRFHLPLIEPDVRICRIRLSKKVHAFACGKRVGVTPVQLEQSESSAPATDSTSSAPPSRAFLCLTIDQNWYNTGTDSSNERFQYAYDQDGNVLYKNNIVAPTFSELYHANSSSTYDNSSAYDNFGQLTGFSRGTLSASGSNSPGGLDQNSLRRCQRGRDREHGKIGISDPLGNWTSSSVNGGTATDRTTNSGNELTAIGGSSLGYDDNGNLISGATGQFYL